MSKAEELAADLEKHWNTQAPLAVAAELRSLSAERDSLRAVNAELMEALELIVSDRDKNANGPEQYVPKSASASVSYWSPSATMVHSEYIAKARAAIASARKLKGKEA